VGLEALERNKMKQRKQGTRIDDLAVEGKPGYIRIIRFGLYSASEQSEELIMNEADALYLTGQLNDYFAAKMEKEFESKEISKKKLRIPVKDVEK
jgi:hypothetical protein